MTCQLVCNFCGQTFEAKNERAKFCPNGGRCKQAAYRRRRGLKRPPASKETAPAVALP